ncbi:hypothetical protein PCASD_23084 [Puccinia coronata f. sp. avenae]|uniref:Uncharacterized protein n=1 Tax=Puccinia coronata f. sp. avenae TaxID=200324 RepID=A0A2N5TPY1_9BASI|nr:hypothetical protein PCASD_23084 [Puccinia coronata f. sp. avenae]
MIAQDSSLLSLTPGLPSSSDPSRVSTGPLASQPLKPIKAKMESEKAVKEEARLEAQRNTDNRSIHPTTVTAPGSDPKASTPASTASCKRGRSVNKAHPYIFKALIIKQSTCGPSPQQTTNGDQMTLLQYPYPDRVWTTTPQVVLNLNQWRTPDG